MRIGRRAIIIGALLAASPAGHAACSGDCEPTTDDVRAKVERLLDSAYATPHALVSFERLDSRSLEMRDRHVYETRFRAVLNYSGNVLRCRNSLCPELHNYAVDIDAAAKKATVAGWLFLEQDSHGWR